MCKFLSGLLCTWVLLAVQICVAGEPGGNKLNFLVYGASGKVGSHVVEEALSRGHRVTAVSREPSRITTVHKHLSVVQGDVLDPAGVARLLDGQDLVIDSVRGIAGNSNTAVDAVPYLAVQNLVEALRRIGNGAPRLIHVGGAGSLEMAPGVLLADRLPKIFMPKSLELEISGQVLALQYLREVDDVPWTYATPPRNFTGGKRTGHYRVGGDQLMVDAQGRSRISRADFAVALVNEAEDPKFIHQRFSVAY